MGSEENDKANIRYYVVNKKLEIIFNIIYSVFLIHHNEKKVQEAKIEKQSVSSYNKCILGNRWFLNMTFTKMEKTGSLTLFQNQSENSYYQMCQIYQLVFWLEAEIKC